MGRIRVSRKLRLYRIVPMSNVTRIAGTGVALAAIAIAVLMPGAMGQAVWMIAVALAIFGLTDVIDGLLATRSRVDRMGKNTRHGQRAITFGIIQTLFGLATVLIALMGLIAWASIETTM